MRNFIIFIIGLPCSGKSTIAHELSKKFNIESFSTEKVRADLLEIDIVKEDCDFTNEQQIQVYNEIYKRVREQLNNSKSVIVEGVYRNNEQRELILNLKNNYSDLEIFGYFLTCDEDETLKRLINRKIKGTVAPAGVNTYIKIKDEFTKPSATFTHFDTTNGVNEIINKIYNEIEGIINE